MRTVLYILFLTLAASCIGQAPEKLRFKKEVAIYFFQAGPATDTISKGKGDLFYFVIPDSLKTTIALHTENAQLTHTTNDSIVCLTHIPGLRYESLFVSDPADSGARLKLRTFVNHTTTLPVNTIRITLVEIRNGTTLIENFFYYRE